MTASGNASSLPLRKKTTEEQPRARFVFFFSLDFCNYLVFDSHDYVRGFRV